MAIKFGLLNELLATDSKELALTFRKNGINTLWQRNKDRTENLGKYALEKQTRMCEKVLVVIGKRLLCKRFFSILLKLDV